MRSATLAIALAGCLGCSSDGGKTEPDLEPSSSSTIVDVYVDEHVDAAGVGFIDLALEGPSTIRIHAGMRPLVLEASYEGEGGPTLVATSGAAPVADTFEQHELGAWLRPQPFSEQAVWELAASSGEVDLWLHGELAPALRRERSLVWTDAPLLDDANRVGLRRVLSTIASDGHGGELLDTWFRRFATTPHSERAAPAQWMDELAAAQGAPSGWDLDTLPFTVTGVHNRHDLGPRSGEPSCGELRVSLASTHPIYSPFHLIFLFRQPVAEHDVAPIGEVHCLATARRWASLSRLDDAAWLEAASAILDDTLRPENFLMAETVELTVSPWEWRQWAFTDEGLLDNPPLFQTVATAALNQPGTLRDGFLSIVESNAAALDAREFLIPSDYRAAAAQVPPGAPIERLSLEGLAAATLVTYPNLAHNIEIVGCPTCHTDDANFVHTTPQRTFSPFYDKELDARSARLAELLQGYAVPAPPFGPLQ